MDKEDAIRYARGAHVTSCVVTALASLGMFLATYLDTPEVYGEMNLYWPDHRQTGVNLGPNTVTKQHLFDVPIGFVAGLMFALDMITHLFSSLFTLDKVIDRQINPLRWINYLFTMALLHTYIGILLGVTDPFQHYLLGCLTLVYALCGLVSEFHEGSTDDGTVVIEVDLHSYQTLHMFVACIGGFALLIQWSFFFTYFAHEANAPSWLYGLVITAFLLELIQWFLSIAHIYRWFIWDFYLIVDLSYVMVNLGLEFMVVTVAYFGTRADR
jgi:hypothetical protein